MAGAPAASPRGPPGTPRAGAARYWAPFAGPEEIISRQLSARSSDAASAGRTPLTGKRTFLFEMTDDETCFSADELLPGHFEAGEHSAIPDLSPEASGGYQPMHHVSARRASIPKSGVCMMVMLALMLALLVSFVGLRLVRARYGCGARGAGDFPPSIVLLSEGIWKCPENVRWTSTPVPQAEISVQGAVAIEMEAPRRSDSSAGTIALAVAQPILVRPGRAPPTELAPPLLRPEGFVPKELQSTALVVPEKLPYEAKREGDLILSPSAFLAREPSPVA